MKTIPAAITILSIGLSHFSYADRYVPTHLCFKPEKPIFISSVYQQEKYKKDVTTFKFCIREFVKNQERSMLIHQEAIKKSTSDWNEFVQEDQ